MDTREIKKLIKLLEDSTLTYLEVSEGDKKIKLKKQNEAPKIVQADVRAFDNVLTTGQGAEQKKAGEDTAAEPEGTPVKAPMLGVFYSKPSPEDEPYVEVGKTVSKGDTLCIIEAMKLMNEIPAEVGGTITKVCANDGDLIEFGQVLFYIK